MLLNIANLHVSYGAIAALRGVSLHIDRGEIVALIGANGAGKSTLLRAISGLLRPANGTITWQNDATPPVLINPLRPDQIVTLGISHVPEGRQVFSNLSVRENLMLGGYQQPMTHVRADIEKCYGLFPVLSERKHQRAGTLSGGEQQMLAIARALMARPQLLLLDEPSLGLAPIIVRKIFQIIHDINAGGTTVFLVEQNAQMALHLAHRGYVLQTGEILMHDTAVNLAANPQVQDAYLGG